MTSLSSWLKLVGVGFVILFVIVAYGKHRDATAQPVSVSREAFTVSFAPVSRTALDEQVSALGTVSPWQEITLSAQSAGIAVVEVRVAENDRVARGDILVRLDDRLLEAQISQQTAAIAEAQANLETATNKAARANTLALTQAMSKEDVEERRTAIKTSQAKLDQAKASLVQLRTQLDQTRIVAPADGYVAQKPVVIGTVVQIGTDLVHLIRDGRLEIEAKVPERELGSVRQQFPARVRDSAGSEIEGRVRAIAAKVDSKTRLGTVYISLPAGSSLRPGMFTRVSIDIGARQVLTIPEKALIWRESKPAVFVLDGNGRAILTPVVTGLRQSGFVAIEHGLNDDDRIVSAGAGFLSDGDKVRAVLADNSATSAGPAR